MKMSSGSLAFAFALMVAACGPPPLAGSEEGTGGAGDPSGLDGGGGSDVSGGGGSDVSGGGGSDVSGGGAGAGDVAAVVDGADATALGDVAATVDAGPGSDAGAGEDGAAPQDAGGPMTDVGGPVVCAPHGPAPGPVGPAGASGCVDPRACAAGQGCHAGVCGACAAPSECRDHDGCRPDGTCGRCSDDAACRAGEACSHGFCVVQTPPVWDLDIDSADWATFWADPYAMNLVPCTLIVDGVPFDGCHVRLRGGSSLDLPKRSFRIEIDGGLPTPGFGNKINLRAEYNDTTYLRNALAMQTFNRMTRLPTSRVRFVQVVLNGSPYGLMAEVERVGDPLLRAHGWTEDVALVEADPTLDLAKLGACALVPVTPKAAYGVAFDAKGNGAKDALAQFIDLVELTIWQDHLDRAAGAPHPARVASQVATDLLTDLIATQALLQGRDHIRKNFYLSKQPWGATDRWAMLPWDLDLTFGCGWTPEHETLCVDQTADYPWSVGMVPDGAPVGYPVEAQYNLLLDLLIRDPAWHEQIRGRICAMIDDPIWTDDIPDLSLALEEALAPFVAEDEKDRVGTTDDFHAAVEGLRTFVVDRRESLRAQLDCGSCL